MAIYHMQAKVVSRGSGRSAVAASAYMSCSRMYNDYDDIQHDYTRKHKPITPILASSIPNSCALPLITLIARIASISGNGA